MTLCFYFNFLPTYDPHTQKEVFNFLSIIDENGCMCGIHANAMTLIHTYI